MQRKGCPMINASAARVYRGVRHSKTPTHPKHCHPSPKAEDLLLPLLLLLFLPLPVLSSQPQTLGCPILRSFIAKGGTYKLKPTPLPLPLPVLPNSPQNPGCPILSPPDRA